VSLAEEGWAGSDVARSVAQYYLKDFSDGRVDALVLGCTHYPILKNVISNVVGRNVHLIDSGEAAAGEVLEILDSLSLAAGPTGGGNRVRQVCDDLDHFYVTDAAERFAKVAERFLGTAPAVLEAVEVWGNDELRT
jgi:glutamate racemase